MPTHAPPPPVLRAAECAWFIDIDGTLLDLAPSPGDVDISVRTRRMLRDLCTHAGGAVALVSGRSLRDVDALFRMPWLAAAGVHGSERRNSAGKMSRSDVSDGALVHARQVLTEVVAQHDGLELEDKHTALALHYRGAPALADHARALMRSLVQASSAAFCVQEGKYVTEMRPKGRDKAAAITAFMHERPFAGRRPVMIGDDLTDEGAFAAVNIMSGISVKVGDGPTSARFRLGNPSAVRSWLADHCE